MVEKYQPLVSVYVITYNSSKTVIETLDSIYNQTYPNIELIVSDDCSPDNTVAMCREWIAAHKDRFVRTELLTVEKNTGISGNGNRAEAACQGEWVKGIAGDDLLVEDCIESCVDYVTTHSGVVLLFGRHKPFGADDKTCQEVAAWFNYDFFSWTKEQKLHQLVYSNNCIAATTLFYNRLKYSELGIKNDEKVPFLEDWTKWITVVSKDIPMHFINKELVKYRIGGICTRGEWNAAYYESHRRLFFYYQYPFKISKDYDAAIEEIIDHEVSLYRRYLDALDEQKKIRKTCAYRIGSFILSPVRYLRSFFAKS